MDLRGYVELARKQWIMIRLMTGQAGGRQIYLDLKLVTGVDLVVLPHVIAFLQML